MTKDNLKIFGAYTDIPWKSENLGKHVKGNGNSFLFSLRSNNQFTKLKNIKGEYEVYHDIDELCCFLNGFYIADNCDNNKHFNDY